MESPLSASAERVNTLKAIDSICDSCLYHAPLGSKAATLSPHSISQKSYTPE